MREFYHIVDRDEWARAQELGAYYAASLDREGFIHCSYREQLLIPANERFRGRRNLLLLRIDPTRVAAEVRHEPAPVNRAGDSWQEVFPHIYGPLNLDAVLGTVDFPPQEDGAFILPGELAE